MVAMGSSVKIRPIIIQYVRHFEIFVDTNQCALPTRLQYKDAMVVFRASIKTVFDYVYVFISFNN